MNLYKLLFSHHAPKGVAFGHIVLLLAQTDEQVYEYIKSQPEIQGETLFNPWSMCEDDDSAFKDKIIELKGEMFDDDVDFSNSYYGITLYGWQLLKENVTTDYSELIELGEIIKIC